jgi:hypothetical protein
MLLGPSHTSRLVRSNLTIRIGWGQNSRGTYRPIRFPFPVFEDGGEEEGESRVNFASRSSHAERDVGQSRERWKRHRCTSGSTRYFVERRRTAERE